ncbi:MAG: hypothetical protein J3Q66DRAFT_351723, partial [Benniella sp.]
MLSPDLFLSLVLISQVRTTCLIDTWYCEESSLDRVEFGPNHCGWLIACRQTLWLVAHPKSASSATSFVVDVLLTLQ